jgi:hypothetical protein
MTEQRPLALLERYQLSRINVGVPATVCLTALLRLSAESTSPLQLEATLARAVSVLVQRYPLLRCRVAGSRTATPRWTLLDSSAPDQFIGTAEAAAAELDLRLSGNEDAAGVIDAAFKYMSRVDPEEGPLWRVWAIEDADSEDKAAARWRRWRIVYATNHILTDGTGARNLFADLLALLHPNNSSLLPARDEKTAPAELPPPMESVFDDVSLSFLDMAKVVWSEFLAAPNLLPGFLRPAKSPIFHRAPLVPPHAQPTAIPRTFTLPASLVGDLKVAAKSNRVATLHPVLYIAGLAAIEAHKFPPPPESTIIVGSTPASVRALAPSSNSLPHATGNYVYEVKVPHATTTALLPFWAECRSYAEKLADPATRQHGLKEIGQLSLVPDGPITPPPSSGGVGPTTKYDAWMTERAQKAEPFETTFEVSNLGVLPPTGWESAHGDGGETGDHHQLVELAWAQTAMTGTIFAINVRPGTSLSCPFLPLLLPLPLPYPSPTCSKSRTVTDPTCPNLQPIAFRGGDLSFTLTYRAGTVEESLVDRIWSSYQDILRKIAAGQVPASATFAELAASA